MPLTGKENQKFSFGYGSFRSRVGCKYTMTFGYIHKLVFTQDSAFLRIKEIAGRMVFQWIRGIRMDGLEAYCIDRQTIFLVHRIYNKILKSYS